VKVAVLEPGERLTVRANAGAAVDRPKLEAATAWRQDEVIFDDTSLLDAVAELNRYGGTQLQVDPGVASLHMSGVFRASDPEAFATAMTQLYHLRMERVGGVVLLER
jgi:transmembrane sensor